MSILRFYITLSLICSFSFLSFAEKDPVIKSVSKKRQYPGGADEEDLKVQDELKVPVAKTDRRSIEIQVLRNHFKKDTPGPMDSDAPTEESE